MNHSSSSSSSSSSALESDSDLFTIVDPYLQLEISTHTPILFDELTNEPYIPLPTPFERFKLTPQRKSDRDDIVEMMNDPKVVYTIVGPPFPFPPEVADKGFKNERASTIDVFAAFARGEWRPAKGSPLRILREMVEGGKDKFVGEVDLRHGFWWKERMTPVKEHWEEWREKEKIFSMGACFKSAYHGQGIGSVATDTLFNQWAIPQMGATEIRAECFLSNVASNRLWEKKGFKEMGEKGTVTIPKEKTGGEEKIERDHTLVWSLP